MKDDFTGMDDLYRDFILDHYRNPRNAGTFDTPDATFEDNNPLCGDKIRMDLKLRDGVIEDIRFRGPRLCDLAGLGVAADRSGEGQDVAEIEKIGKEEVLENLGIQISAARLKCALLGLKVLKQALALTVASDL